MSRKIMQEIINKNDQELAKFVTEQRQALAQAVVDLKTKEVKQVRQIRNIKRTIARALTVQSERELKALEANHE